MGKSLIIGAMTNYNFEQVRPWVRSIEMSGFEGDKVMIVLNGSYDTVQELIKHDFDVIAFGRDDENKRFVHKPFGNLTIHLERFLHIYNYLAEDNKWMEYDSVITTDVKDVVFQSNPIEWITDINGWPTLIVGSESIRYQDEPWGNQNLLDCYGPYFHNMFKHKEIYNVGVLAGNSENIKDLALNIFLNGLNRPIPIVDQAVFNMLIQGQPYLDSTYYMDQASGWALHAGTTADPTKIDAFRPYLTEYEPIIKDGIAYTHSEKKFCVFHQYDRIPGIREQVLELYK